MRGLHTLSFDPAAFSEDERVTAWMRFFSKISAIVPLPADPFLPRASIWIAERVTFTFAKSHPQYHKSEEALGFNLDQRDMVMAWTCKKGLGQYLHAGQIFNIRPGDVFFMDISRDVRAFMTDAEMYSVIIPHALVGYEPDHAVPHALFKADSPTAIWFKDWVFKTFLELPQKTQVEATELALKTKEMMRDVISAANAKSAAELTFPEKVSEYVDERIFDPNLSIETLMDAFGLSRAQLYELAGFSRGLEPHIRIARLEYSLRSLVFGRDNMDRISLVAERLAYPTIEAFSSAFQAHFNILPESVLGVLSHDRPKTGDRLWDTWLGDDHLAS